MNMTEKTELKMTFDANVIEHLGVRMYSTLPPVLSELIANAYDADATKVSVELHDKDKKNMKIIVKDDGIGMSFDDIQEKFLPIGRNRREKGDKRTPGGRDPIGKKGLGKLSFFGIVTTITVNTVKANKNNIFVMDWDKLMASKKGVYSVDHQAPNRSVNKKNGTTITLTNIKRKTDFDGKSIAHCISRFFVFDDEFSVSVRHNNDRPIEVTNEMRFDQLDEEFVWEFPKHLKGSKHYPHLVEHDIKGKVITSIEPIPPSMRARGIALFARKKLVQAPSFYADSTSSHFFSYLSGSLSADFIDDISEDVISTNRLSLNWEHPEMHKLQSVLAGCISHIHRKWRNKRKRLSRNKVKSRIRPGWYDSMPSKIRTEVKKLVESLLVSAEEQDMTKEDMIMKAVDLLQEIIPPYPAFHWRHIHESLHKPLKELYKKKEFLSAAEEGVKIYEEAVCKKSKVADKDGADLFQQVFSEQNAILEIPHPFKKPETGKNIQDGQRFLSAGLVKSFRNPVSHSSRHYIRKFFAEADFLDILSLISFLLRRVETAEKVKPAKKRRKKK